MRFYIQGWLSVFR